MDEAVSCPSEACYPSNRKHGRSWAVNRRELITLVGGAAAAWPLEARAQQSERVRRIGVLMSIREDDPLAQERVATFRQALAELCWTEDRNLSITWRWTGGDMVRVREYAAELVRLAPEVILAN